MKQLILRSMTLLFCIAPFNSYSYDFSWDNLMYADAKLTTSFDYEVFVDSYMKIYRKPIWDKYKNDEFELESKREETIQIMKGRFEEFDLDQEFLIHTAVKFGEYNFNNEEFPIDGFSTNSFFTESRRYYGNNAFPYTYKVFFENHGIVKNLKMDKEIAKGFVQSRKNDSGRIDRKLPVQIKFKVKERSGVGELRADITEVIIYESRDRSAVLATFK